jgi:hypothetical protein
MAAPVLPIAGDLGRFVLTVTSSFFCCLWQQTANWRVYQFGWQEISIQKGKSLQAVSLAWKSRTSLMGT